jgi:hypothetical protein
MYFGLSSGRRFALGAAPNALINPAITHPGQITTGTVQSPDNAKNQALENYGTSDGRLIWQQGAWRVVSDDSAVTFAGHVAQSAHDIITAGYPVFIGPLAWSINGGAIAADESAINRANMVFGSTVADLTSAAIKDSASGQQAMGVQITTISDPAQIPKGWRDWFAAAFATALRTGLPNHFPDAPTSFSFPYFDPTRGFAGKLPAGCCPDGSKVCTVPATWGGQPNTQGYQECNCTSDPGCYKHTQSTPNKPVVFVGAAPDANNFPAEWVQYAGDPNVYKWFDTRDWLNSFKPGLSDQDGIAQFFWNSGGVAKTDAQLAHQFFEYDPPLNVPPISKFRHPITGDTWGIWMAAIIDSNAYANGAWNVQTDNPNGYKLKIGIGPLPQEPWYDYIIDALEWIPMTLGGLAADALSAILSLVCSNPAQATQMAKSSPYAAAAVLAASKLCHKPPTSSVNCLDPAQAATNPICRPPDATPWYLQWYVIVGVIGAVGLGIISAKKSRTAPTNP